MPDFTYTALATSGTKSTGTVTAGNEREAAALLDAKGLFPISIALAGVSGGSKFDLFGGVSGRQLATMYGQLADLLQAGVPLFDVREGRPVEPRLERRAEAGGQRIRVVGGEGAEVVYDAAARWIGFATTGEDGSTVTYARA